MSPSLAAGRRSSPFLNVCESHARFAWHMLEGPALAGLCTRACLPWAQSAPDACGGGGARDAARAERLAVDHAVVAVVVHQDGLLRPAQPRCSIISRSIPYMRFPERFRQAALTLQSSRAGIAKAHACKKYDPRQQTPCSICSAQARMMQGHAWIRHVLRGCHRRGVSTHRQVAVVAGLIVRAHAVEGCDRLPAHRHLQDQANSCFAWSRACRSAQPAGRFVCRPSPACPSWGG